MKKKFITGLMLLSAVSMLTACGGDKKTEDAGTDTNQEATTEESTTEAASDEKAGADLTLWTYPVGQWGNSDTVDGLLASFNEKYPDIHVTVEYLDYQNGDDQVNTAIEGNKAPDLILEGPERLVANWGQKGLMVDLKDLFDKDAAKDLNKNAADACKNDAGAYYEYPLCMVAHCMAINQKIFEDANAMQYIDVDNHSWTTENFEKAVKAVYDSGHKDVAAVYCGGQGGDQGTRALVNNMYGGKFTNAEHTKYAADDPANIKALQDLQKMEGINFDASIVAADEIQLFTNETLAMGFCWNAMLQNSTDGHDAGKTANGNTILPMLFPTEDGKPNLCGGIWGFGIFDNGNAEKIEAAKTFIDFMCNDPEQVKANVVASGFFPAHTEIGNVYEGTDIAETMGMYQEKFMPFLGDYYQVTPGWPQARTAWWNMLQKIGTGSDVAQELKAFQEEANKAAEETVNQ